MTTSSSPNRVRRAMGMARRQTWLGWLLTPALIALLIGRRVIPFFAMRATPGLDIPKHTGTGQVQLGACTVAALCQRPDDMPAEKA